MGELINGRTLEEIRAAVINCDEHCSCIDCPEDERDYCDQSVVIKYARCLIEHLESERDAALAKVPKWTSVKERLPEEHGIYLAHIVHRYCKIDSYSRVAVEYFSRDGKWDSLPDLYEVTHWMPLPEPPEEGE